MNRLLLSLFPLVHSFSHFVRDSLVRHLVFAYEQSLGLFYRLRFSILTVSPHFKVGNVLCLSSQVLCKFVTTTVAIILGGLPRYDSAV